MSTDITQNVANVVNQVNEEGQATDTDLEKLENQVIQENQEIEDDDDDLDDLEDDDEEDDDDEEGTSPNQEGEVNQEGGKKKKKRKTKEVYPVPESKLIWEGEEDGGFQAGLPTWEYKYSKLKLENFVSELDFKKYEAWGYHAGRVAKLDAQYRENKQKILDEQAPLIAEIKYAAEVADRMQVTDPEKRAQLAKAIGVMSSSGIDPAMMMQAMSVYQEVSEEHADSEG